MSSSPGFGAGGGPLSLARATSTAPADAPDPLDLVRGARGRDVFYQERPADGRALVAVGAAHAIEARGPGRFAQVKREVAALVPRLPDRAHVRAEAGPILVGGFGFDEAPPGAGWSGFPPARWVLPELAWVRGPQGTCTTWAGRGPAPDPDELEQRIGALARTGAAARDAGPLAGRPEFRARPDRSPAAFRTLVESALRSIRAGELEKLVVARAVDLALPEPARVASLLGHLRRVYPTCTIFAVVRHDGAAFVGATPERLVRVRRDRVEALALAGSAPRGRTPEEDARRARELLESKKEQAEHAAVVRALRAALESHCDELRVPEAPRVAAVAGIQHLATPIRARLRRGRDRAGRTGVAALLELVEHLHPTPAVGGAPRERALAWLRRHEDLDRGWYAGAVGWLGLDGDGELDVALRCARIRGREARLFAGAGIVEGSCPDAELAETRLKLRALLAPLVEL